MGIRQAYSGIAGVKKDGGGLLEPKRFSQVLIRLGFKSTLEGIGNALDGNGRQQPAGQHQYGGEQNGCPGQ